MKRVLVVLAVLLLVAGFFTSTASPAHASTAISGGVTCATGNNVEGIWVAATSGTSGWATMQYPGNTHSSLTWTYTLTSGNSYSIHVGCGGTPNNWAVTTTSATFTGNSYNLTCYDYGNYPLPPAYWYRCA